MSDQLADAFVTVSGHQIRHRVWGSGAPEILLLHGIMSSLESWLPNIPALSAAHRVRALDLLGSGRSDKPKVEYSIQTLAESVKQYMEATGMRDAVVIGHSLGGGVALELAMRWPHLVRRLVLVAPAGLSRKLNLFLRLATLPGLGQVLTRPSRAGTEMGLKSCVHDPALVTPAAVALGLELASLPGAQDALLSTLRTLNDLGGLRAEIQRSLTERLPSVAAPALVVWGRQDQIQPVAASDILKARLPTVQVHILDRCGHMPHQEHPDTFHDLVLKFLA